MIFAEHPHYQFEPIIEDVLSSVISRVEDAVLEEDIEGVLDWLIASVESSNAVQDTEGNRRGMPSGLSQVTPQFIQIPASRVDTDRPQSNPCLGVASPLSPTTRPASSICLLALGDAAAVRNLRRNSCNDLGGMKSGRAARGSKQAHDVA